MSDHPDTTLEVTCDLTARAPETTEELEAYASIVSALYCAFTMAEARRRDSARSGWLFIAAVLLFDAVDWLRARNPQWSVLAPIALAGLLVGLLWSSWRARRDIAHVRAHVPTAITIRGGARKPATIRLRD